MASSVLALSRPRTRDIIMDRCALVNISAMGVHGLHCFAPNFLSSQLNTDRSSSCPARRIWDNNQIVVGFSPVMFLAP
jgi:hypothetical protein